jgi:hypothetical protein
LEGPRAYLRFSLLAWNNMHAFYSGASLYDHDQVAIYKKALEECNSKKRCGIRRYKPYLKYDFLQVELCATLPKREDLYFAKSNVEGE